MAELVGVSEEIKMEGYLRKLGAVNPTWKKRYFVLKGTVLYYQKKKESKKVRGEVDLALGRGVRPREQCWDKVNWPKKTSNELCFGISTEKRTYYIYAETADEVSSWKEALQNTISECSKAVTDQWEADPEGKPKTKEEELAKSATKFTAKLAKAVAKSGVVKGPAAKAIEGAANLAENQAEMGPNATLGDRLRHGAGDVVGTVGDSVDNQWVKAGADVAKEQLQADKDTSISQRVMLGVGTGMGGVGEAIGNPIASDVLNAAGQVLHDQGELDSDADWKERVITGVGSIAGGVENSVDNELVKEATKGVKEGASLANGLLKK